MKMTSKITMTALALGVLLGTSEFALAKKNCTDLPKEQWMKVEDFQKKVIADGYTIKKFKQPGTCYEIYGTNKDGKKVEVYFNPVDGTVVKAK